MNFKQVEAIIEYTKGLLKSNCPTPPGPPPRPGLVWNPNTCRWTRPKEGVQPELFDRKPYYVEPPKPTIDIPEVDPTDSPFSTLTYNGQETISVSDSEERAVYEDAQKFYQAKPPKYFDKGKASDFDNSQIDYYTGSGAYSLNKQLRGKGPMSEGNKAILKALTDNMGEIGESPVLFRGIKGRLNDLYNIEENSVLDIDTFMSTSRNPGIALDFAFENNSEDVATVLEIYPSPQAQGIVLPPGFNGRAESETILGHNQKLLIHAVHEDVDLNRHGSGGDPSDGMIEDFYHEFIDDVWENEIQEYMNYYISIGEYEDPDWEPEDEDDEPPEPMWYATDSNSGAIGELYETEWEARDAAEEYAKEATHEMASEYAWEQAYEAAAERGSGPGGNVYIIASLVPGHTPQELIDAAQAKEYTA